LGRYGIPSYGLAEARCLNRHQGSPARNARLDTVTETIVTAVKKGNPVSLAGFGRFKLVARPARTGCNPQSGKKIKIAAAKVLLSLPEVGHSTVLRIKAHLKAIGLSFSFKESADPFRTAWEIGRIARSKSAEQRAEFGVREHHDRRRDHSVHANVRSNQPFNCG
jgi:DNA-binding protein HU-beta